MSDAVRIKLSYGGRTFRRTVEPGAFAWESFLQWCVADVCVCGNEMGAYVYGSGGWGKGQGKGEVVTGRPFWWMAHKKPTPPKQIYIHTQGAGVLPGPGGPPRGDADVRGRGRRPPHHRARRGCVRACGGAFVRVWRGAYTPRHDHEIFFSVPTTNQPTNHPPPSPTHKITDFREALDTYARLNRPLRILMEDSGSATTANAPATPPAPAVAAMAAALAAAAAQEEQDEEDEETETVIVDPVFPRAQSQRTGATGGSHNLNNLGSSAASVASTVLGDGGGASAAALLPRAASSGAGMGDSQR